MAKLRAHDPEWETLALRGISWQVLSRKIMLEPNACLTISIGLNKKYGAAMKVGSGEIFRYMIQLCNPAPQPTPWIPVRDEVIRFYEGAAEDTYLPHAFQYILEAGGRGSMHLNDYIEFMHVAVDPIIRQFTFKAYRNVVQVPPKYQRIRLALLCWAFRQNKERTWCVLPPDIGWRFKPKANQVSWIEFFVNVEAVLSYLRYVIMEHPPTVVGDKKTRTYLLGGINATSAGAVQAMPVKTFIKQRERLCQIKTKPIRRRFMTTISTLTQCSSPILPNLKIQTKVIGIL